MTNSCIISAPLIAKIDWQSGGQKINNSIYSRAGLNAEYLIIDAIYSDETEHYVNPCEPDFGEPTRVKLRTARGNADAAYVCADNADALKMELALTDGIFDYYEAVVRPESIVRYYFKIVKNKANYFFNGRGLYDFVDTGYNFQIVPGFKTPEWARGAVMYQIYVDRFYNGDKSNDVMTNEYTYLSDSAKRIEDWNRPVSTFDVCNFYGGDLRGVIEKMDYLNGLGVECIYFTPLFVSPSNHKYDIQDYDYIDPHIGVIVNDGGSPLSFDKFHNRFATMYMLRTTDKENLEASNALMCELIELAHEKNIKVILDGVFNHCGAYNKWLDKEGFYFKNGYPPGAYRDEKSRYHNFFYWYDSNWPNNDCYMGWWGHDNHPKLNYDSSPELYEYILNIARKWVSPPFNADGWRLDVPYDLGTSPEINHKFWKDFRKAVKEANPNAIIIAEQYGDATNWLKGDEWDTVMNYDAFMEPITWFLTGMQKHSNEFKSDMLCNAMAFENTMRYFAGRIPNQSKQTAMNHLSNHDHSRFLTRTNMKAGRLHTSGAAEADSGTDLGIMMNAVTFQMTWPGAPVIYYGDEAGLTGWTDPDNRRTYPWGNENKDLLEYHRAVINIRRLYGALKNGSLIYLHLDYGVLSYGRWDDENKCAVVINNNTYDRIVRVPVWKTGAVDGVMKTLIYSSDKKYDLNEISYQIKNGYISLMMRARSSAILKNEK